MDEHDVSNYSRSVSKSLTFLVMLFFTRKVEIPRQGMQVCVVRPMIYRAGNEEIFL